MKVQVTLTKCDYCKQDIDNTDERIGLPDQNLDIPSIWCGDIPGAIWLRGEVFCCWEHMLAWLEEQRAELRRQAEARKSQGDAR